MALDNAKNFAKATVSAGYDSSAVSIDLTSGGGLRLPAPSFNAVWWNATEYPDPSDDPLREVIRVTNIVTDTLTITRAQEGTSAQDHNLAGRTYKIIAGMTAKTINTDMANIVNGPETPVGDVNGTNVTFTVSNIPKYIISDGATYFEGYGYTIAGLTLTLSIPPSGVIRSFY